MMLLLLLLIARLIGVLFIAVLLTVLLTGVLLTVELFIVHWSIVLLIVLFFFVVLLAVLLTVLLTVLLLQWVAFLMLEWNECSGESGMVRRNAGSGESGMVRRKGTRERSASALLGEGPIDGKTRDKTIDCLLVCVGCPGKVQQLIQVGMSFTSRRFRRMQQWTHYVEKQVSFTNVAITLAKMRNCT
jgi:hypothetical protein